MFRLSMALVTGMISVGAVLSSPVNRVYVTTIRDKGHRGSTNEWAGPSYTMSRELELVVGRPCDPPGCAASANP